MATGRDLCILLDSKVIISGIYSRDGPAAQIVDLHSTDELKIVIGQLVLDEVVRTLRIKNVTPAQFILSVEL